MAQVSREKKRKMSSQTPSVANFFKKVSVPVPVQFASTNEGQQIIALDDTSASTSKESPEIAKSHTNKHDGREVSSDKSTLNINREQYSKHDIGLYTVGKTTGDDVKMKMLKEPWIPSENFNFPIVGPRKLKFQRQWLLEFPWLSYSSVKEGAFCRICVLFASECAGKGKNQVLGSLVTKSFCNWKDAKEVFRSHQLTLYHSHARTAADNFLSVKKGTQDSVDIQLNQQLKAELDKNRRMLNPIIKTVILCGRQELALRAHRDSGPLSISVPEQNDGNFRALLRYRCDAGDLDLREHVENGKKNAMYLSPAMQNAIISSCGDVIQSKLVAKVNSAECFAVLADETTDISGIEQFSLCARYVEKQGETSVLREDFLGFVPVENLTGVGLANTLISSLIDYGVDTTYLRGQGYDGAAAMSGKFQGVQAIIQKDHPSALYVHCANHSLNLAISSACTIQSIRNAFGTIKEVCHFFSCSGKRQRTLQESVLNKCQDSNKSRLKSLCETRWIERHDAISTFLELYNAVLDALHHIAANYSNADDSSKAERLASAIEKSPFLISIIVCDRVFGITLPLAKALQKENNDLSVCVDLASDVETEVKNLREHAEQEFKELFQVATSIAVENHIELCKPRTAGKQSHRENHISESTEGYFRVSVFIPFLEFLVDQLNIRFLQHKSVISQLVMLLPRCALNTDMQAEHVQKDLEFILKQWIVDINQPLSVLRGEYSLWVGKWKKEVLLGCSIAKKMGFLDALNKCDVIIFPTIHKLLKIAATLPVSVATAERTFSTLRRLKTYLRNSMTGNRLTGLALMAIHRDVSLEPEEVATLLNNKGYMKRMPV